MVKGLSSKDLDVAIALTEGLISAIAKGNTDFTIIGTYVDAPLTWAISAGQGSPHSSVDSLLNATIGISRLGSGSHIMSYVLADQMGWLKSNSTPAAAPTAGAMTAAEDEEVFKFAVLKDFKGLRDGVNSQAADAFMWEQFTTKPFHDTREVKRIGQITTPWPAFLIAVRTELLQQEAETVKRLMVAITESCALFMRERESGASVDYVARTYHQKEEDVRAWFSTVRYADDCSHVSREVLSNCVGTLIKARVLEGEFPAERLVDQRVAALQ